MKSRAFLLVLLLCTICGISLVSLRQGRAWAESTTTTRAVKEMAKASNFVLYVGVRDYPLDRNALLETDPAALIVQRAVSAGLVDLVATKGAPSGNLESDAVRLRLADSFQVSPDYKKWSFRILSSTVHSSGTAVDAIDVVASMERCKAQGQLSLVKDLNQRTVQSKKVHHNEEWVDIELDLPADKTEARKAIAKFNLELSHCAIFSGSALKGFGADFGQMSNIVGPGDYVIDDIRGTRELRLVRVSSSLAPATSPSAVIIRAFPDDSAALATLRSGGIDLFMGAGPEIVAVARKDETLAVGECQGFIIIKRHDLQLSCTPQLELRTVAYQQH